MTVQLVGVELEGRWDETPNNEEVKHDGSVEIDGVCSGEGDCEGNCRDDCECSSYCECEECHVCEHCEDQTNNCACDYCMICSACDNSYEDCDCVKKQSDCTVIKCTESQPCDDCIEAFNDSQEFSYRCEDTFNNCSLDGVCSCECSCDCDCGDNLIGEIASQPLKTKDIEPWITDNYPDEVNDTCGLHVHVSLKNNIEYMFLMNGAFHSYYLEKMIAWGEKNKINEGSEFWKRIEGQNEYCMKTFNPREQRDGEGERYGQLNFCYAKHGTLEFRMLPCFHKKTIAVKAVKETVKIVNSFLRSMPKRQHTIILEVI